MSDHVLQTSKYVVMPAILQKALYPCLPFFISLPLLRSIGVAVIFLVPASAPLLCLLPVTDQLIMRPSRSLNKHIEAPHSWRFSALLSPSRSTRHHGLCALPHVSFPTVVCSHYTKKRRDAPTITVPSHLKGGQVH